MATIENMVLAEQENFSKARKKLNFLSESKDIKDIITPNNQAIITPNNHLPIEDSKPKSNPKTQNCPFCHKKDLAEKLIDHVKSCEEYEKVLKEMKCPLCQIDVPESMRIHLRYKCEKMPEKLWKLEKRSFINNSKENRNKQADIKDSREYLSRECPNCHEMKFHWVLEKHLENCKMEDNGETNQEKNRELPNLVKVEIQENVEEKEKTDEEKNLSTIDFESHQLDLTLPVVRLKKTKVKRFTKCSSCNEMIFHKKLMEHMENCKVESGGRKNSEKKDSLNDKEPMDDLIETEKDAIDNGVETQPLIRLEKGAKEKGNELNKSFQEENNDKTIDRKKGKRPTKECKFCNEPYAEFILPKHKKSCRRLVKFIAKVSNGYECKICSLKRDTRKLISIHIHQKHKESLKNPDQLEQNIVKENYESNPKNESMEKNKAKSKIAVNPFYQPTNLDSNVIPEEQFDEKSENNSIDKIEGIDKEKSDGKRPKITCEICHEMYTDSKLPKHRKVCKIFFKFLKQTSKGYGCLLCKSETSKRNSMHQHIKEKHANEISEKNKENFSKNIEINENEASKDMPFAGVNIDDTIKDIDQEKTDKGKNEGKRPRKSHKNEIFEKSPNIFSKNFEVDELQPMGAISNNIFEEESENARIQPSNEVALSEVNNDDTNENTKKSKIEQDETKGKGSKRECKFCLEMISDHFLLKHKKTCKIYYKYVAKVSDDYQCALCSQKKSTRNMMHLHIKQKHKIGLKKWTNPLKNDNQILKSDSNIAQKNEMIVDEYDQQFSPESSPAKGLVGTPYESPAKISVTLTCPFCHKQKLNETLIYHIKSCEEYQTALSKTTCPVCHVKVSKGMRLHLKYKCKKINWSTTDSENSNDNTNIENIDTKADSDIEMITPKNQDSGLDWNLVNENNFDIVTKNNRPKKKSGKIRVGSNRSNSNKDMVPQDSQLGDMDSKLISEQSKERDVNKGCEICGEMISKGMYKHLKACKTYYKFTKKTSEGYKCKLCSTKTSNINLLRAHIKSKHKKEILEKNTNIERMKTQSDNATEMANPENYEKGSNLVTQKRRKNIEKNEDNIEQSKEKVSKTHVIKDITNSIKSENSCISFESPDSEVSDENEEEDDDDRALKIIYTCPFDEKKYASLEDIENHIFKIHKIPKKLQRETMHREDALLKIKKETL